MLIFRIGVIALIFGFMVIGCKLGKLGISNGSWDEYQDPAGFSLEIPNDWKVTTENGRIKITGSNNEAVTIFPLKIEGNLNPQIAQNVLLQISKQFSPRQQWKMPKNGWQFGKNGVRAVGTDESKLKEVSALWWVNTKQDAVGFFYETAAQPKDFDSLAPTFAKILSSFQVVQTTDSKDSKPTDALQFQQWIDPTESAFSLDVPTTWKPSGGITRASGTTRSEIDIQSPDGQIKVQLNDAKFVIKYSEYSQSLADLGYQEGQMVSSDTQIMRYMSGEQFAGYYVQNTIGRSCTNLKKIDSKDRNDYVQSLAAQGMLPPQYSAYTAGDITFSCEINGQKYVGYEFAETYKVDYQGVGNMWNIRQLYGFIAPENKAAVGNAVLQQAISTQKVNPQWFMGEMKMNQQMAQDYQRYLEYSTNLQKETLAERWGSSDRIAEQRGDLLTGVTKVVDPETGNSYKVQSSSKYYWIDSKNGVIAGTNQPYQPNWDFKEMVETYK